MFKVTNLVPAAVLFSALLSAGSALAETRIVPDNLLRSWDPITVFFDTPAGNLSEDGKADARALFSKFPDHPGAFDWIDARTVQFRPAEPWPALTRIVVATPSRKVELATLLEPPVSTSPAAGSHGLANLDRIVLGFANPVSAQLLRSQLRVGIQSRSAVGTSASGVNSPSIHWVDSTHVNVKVLEQDQPGGTVTAVVSMLDPVPADSYLHLTLALSDAVDSPIWRARYTTASPFRPVSFGCAKERYPVASGGAHYGPESPLNCSGAERRLAVEFSANLKRLNPIDARNLIRITPTPENLRFSMDARHLMVDASFLPDTLYQIALTDGWTDGSGLNDVPVVSAVTSSPGRLEHSSAYVQFAAKPPFLKWAVSSGTLERYGAKHVPLTGRGDGKVDLRIHRIEPTDRTFWPFPKTPVAVDDLLRPPGPGEEPKPFRAVDRHVSAAELAAHLKALGSPDYSAISTLALREGAAAARFGLDLAPALEAIGADAEAGAYLVGIRRLTGDSTRSWMHVQVTDLAVSTVESEDAVMFVVTSLKTGHVRPGAEIEVQGWRTQQGWQPLISGKTNALGQFEWRPGDGESGGAVMRVVVRSGDDVLVVDPAQPPERFADNQWSQDRDVWLQWTRAEARHLTPEVSRHCHLFSERPVYRPDEPVHLKGWLRTRNAGEFAAARGKGTLVITGPGEREWRIPATLSARGTFYHRFDEQKLPAGEYRAQFEYADWGQCGGFGFRKEDYKLPELEVLVHAPDRIGLDAPFEASMTARYYAGGRVAERPLKWRVTQFPHHWVPIRIPGFKYASRNQFSRDTRLASEAVLEQAVNTDSAGSARLNINPAAEASAMPRRYVIEATVTGNDGRTVTATRQVLGLPAVAVAVKMPAVVRGQGVINPEVLVVGPDGSLIADQTLTVRLRQRQWHAHLRAGDFSSGNAKYVTEHVDKTIAEQQVISAEQPVAVPMPVSDGGVYIVDVEARDQLGRVQTVSADFFMAGDESLTWSRAPARVFAVSQDKKSYEPGAVAQLVLQSPYANARALMVEETPAGNRYTWVDVTNGTAMVDVPVPLAAAPRMPVHFLLMRGRISEPVGGQLDLGRPATVASTVWLNVTPSRHQVTVDVSHPPRARPGERVRVELGLSDSSGEPVSGEVTLWLVDQAVLALGRERRLDPMRDFVVARAARNRFYDTRNRLFGFLPFEEYPGGGAADSEPTDLLDNVTPRKRFVPVAFYAPSIDVDASGKAFVEFDLPDNLTVFKVRAKAVSGAGRFGYTTGSLAVRLPLIVQPALPRFVRPGDRFEAAAVARVVDGPEGPGFVAARVEGDASLTVERAESESAGSDLAGSDLPDGERAVVLAKVAARTAFPVEVEDNAEGSLKVSMAVQRRADGLRDAFAVELPVITDRRPVTERVQLALDPGATISLPALSRAARPGSLSRRLIVSQDPTIMGLVGATSFLLDYPHACTEQRISKARAGLAMARFSKSVGISGIGSEQLLAGMDETFSWIDEATDDRGLVAYWPGSKGYVSVTAWALQLAVAARNGGFAVPDGLEERLARTLRLALRSDFPAFVDGAALAERTWALSALADAGLVDDAYAAELARRAQFLPLENTAQVLRALLQSGITAGPATDALRAAMTTGIRTRLELGSERYLGLVDRGDTHGVLLPGEVRTLAEILRTSKRLGVEPTRIDMLRDALVALGKDDGWGSTNANAAALHALADLLGDSMDASQSQSGQNESGRNESGQSQTQQKSASATGAIRLQSATGTSDWQLSKTVETRELTTPHSVELIAGSIRRPLSVRLESRFLPEASGAEAQAQTNGFVVRREWLRVPGGEKPMQREALDAGATAVTFAVGEVIEEHVQVVNSVDRFHVAVSAPLAAGLEPLNPALATAPPEAQPSAPDSRAATYRDARDAAVTWYFDYLPKGVYSFRYRVSAVTPGSFVQPPAFAEAMYDAAVHGSSPGARVEVRP